MIRIGITLRMVVENGLKYGQMSKDELEAVNASGGINGKKIEVILLDDECKPDKGIANVNRFIHQHKVHLVMGSTCSSVTLPMVDVTAKEEVPQIVPHSTNGNITKKGSAWVFRTSGVRAVLRLRARQVSVRERRQEGRLSLHDGRRRHRLRQGLHGLHEEDLQAEPVYEAQMQETDLDFRAHLLKIKSLNPDVLAIGGQPDAIARISQQSYEVGIPKKVRRVAASAASNAPVPELAGDAAGGPDVRRRVLLQGRASGRPGLREDGADQVQVRCPDHDFSQAYDTAQIIKLALEECETRSDGRDP